MEQLPFSIDRGNVEQLLREHVGICIFGDQCDGAEILFPENCENNGSCFDLAAFMRAVCLQNDGCVDYGIPDIGVNLRQMPEFSEDLYCTTGICQGNPAEPVQVPGVRPNSGDNEVNVGSADANGDGGADEVNRSYPYVVALLRDSEAVCSGSIIGARAVLTAAHCVCGSALEEVFVGTSVFTNGSGEIGFEARYALNGEYETYHED